MKKRHSPEQIVSKLRQADVGLGKGLKVPEVCKQLPKRSGEYFFEIIMRRYESRSTVMAFNRPIEDWGKRISDVPAAGAILDRFLHHAQIIPITGKSCRLRSNAWAETVDHATCKADKEKVK